MKNEIKKYWLSTEGYYFTNDLGVAILYKQDGTFVDSINSVGKTDHNIINHFEAMITLGRY